MNMNCSIALMVVLLTGFIDIGHSNLPAVVPPVVVPASAQNGRSCPTESVADASLRSAREAVQSVLQDTVLPILNSTPPYGCDQSHMAPLLCKLVVVLHLHLVDVIQSLTRL